MGLNPMGSAAPEWVLVRAKLQQLEWSPCRVMTSKVG